MINISALLNKNENDYIFSLCNIENHNTNSDTKFRIWFDHFIKNHKIIKGDLFEFGVYRGNSLISIHKFSITSTMAVASSGFI